VHGLRKSVTTNDFRHITRFPLYLMEKNAKQQAAPKVERLTVNLPDIGFPTILFFNRFGIERGDGYSLVHFGFIDKGGDVLASYTTIITDSFVQMNQEDWSNYLGKIGEPPEHALDLSWRPPITRSRAVEVTNALRFARSGPDAEIRCYCVSMVAVVDRTHGKGDASKPLDSQPLALLQTSIEQQKLFLVALLKRDSK
jgi:hypothetical protein